MEYSKIRDLFKEKGIKDIEAEIVSCVNSSSYKLNDEEFDLICSYTRGCWNDLEKTYIQLLTDIICDLYQDLEYGYKNDEHFLTLEDIKEGDKKEMVIDIFYQFDCY